VSREQLLPAIRFLEERIQSFVSTLNYLRSHANMPPLDLTERPDPAPPDHAPK